MSKIYFVIFEKGYSLVRDLSVIPKDIIKSVHEIEDKKYTTGELERLYDNKK